MVIKFLPLTFLLIFLVASYSSSDEGIYDNGEAVITKYKCRTCHTINGKGADICPDLTQQGVKVKPDWEFKFLKSPFKIRPLKIEEMPEFGMPDEDIHAIIEYFLFLSREKNLLKVKEEEIFSDKEFSDGEMLFKYVLGCTGCHSINGEGGWAGPELSNSGGRLRSGWLGKWLADPQAIYPKTNMPSYKMEEWEIKALSAYLLTLRTEMSADDQYGEDEATEYEEMTEQPVYVLHNFLEKLPKKIDSSSTGKELYLWYCASCHGVAGDGRGVNAPYIDPRPRNLLRNNYIPEQTDETLYEIITKGGRAIGKSPYMPPWSRTLNEKQTRAIIRYLRGLSL